MTSAREIVDIALSQVGYTEYPSGSNNTKYGAAYGLNYEPWCMIFIWWVFNKAGASELFFDGGKCAGCTTFMRWAIYSGRWVTDGYRPGDVVLYQFDGDDYADHCGIVEYATDTEVVAIEGNTSSSGSQDNGGAVLRKTRPLSVVLGAYRPDYGAGGTPAQEGGFDLAKLSMISKGSYGAQVRAMQTLLIGYGYSCGRWGADGDCGSATVRAVTDDQAANGLDADGICGPKTWACLLGA
ncbi:MAG: peptidoglycan-binding protein [Oscillospiraceae bacterium]|nr:peptidoglycan-binding protein [Oscillospiraceae bacterium]